MIMVTKSSKNIRYEKARDSVLLWYSEHGRSLPWRAKAGEIPSAIDPYRVWLAEIMLQQTTVATVKGYFEDFISRWSSIEALAKAPRTEVMAAWSGLGYYARARHLHMTAQKIVKEHGGKFPRSEKELLKLPGIGSYTAAAIMAIGFGERAVVVDANIERVIARLEAITTPLPQAKNRIYATMDALTPDKRAGDFAQALMDIGADICLAPRKDTEPRCAVCPLAETCKARQKGIAASLPKKLAKLPRPDRYGVALVIEDTSGRVLLMRRGDKGMLGGMLVFPGSNWADGSPSITDYPLRDNALAKSLYQQCGKGRVLDSKVEHVFTHFRVVLEVIKITTNKPLKGEGLIWLPKDKLKEEALPTVMRKVARLAKINA